MPGELPLDVNTRPMQIFTPSRVEAVTDAGTSRVFTPGLTDRAFLSAVAANYVITTRDGDAQTEVPLAANRPVGIIPGYTYTFDADMLLEVM